MVIPTGIYVAGVMLKRNLFDLCIQLNFVERDLFFINQFFFCDGPRVHSMNGGQWTPDC